MLIECAASYQKCFQHKQKLLFLSWMIHCSCCLSAKNVTVSHDILIIPDRLVSDPSAVNLKNSTREDREEINCNDQKVKGESITKVAEQSALINKMTDKMYPKTNMS